MSIQLMRGLPGEGMQYHLKSNQNQKNREPVMDNKEMEMACLRAGKRLGFGDAIRFVECFIEDKALAEKMRKEMKRIYGEE